MSTYPRVTAETRKVKGTIAAVKLWGNNREVIKDYGFSDMENGKREQHSHWGEGRIISTEVGDRKVRSQ